MIPPKPHPSEHPRTSYLYDKCDCGSVKTVVSNCCWKCFLKLERPKRTETLKARMSIESVLSLLSDNKRRMVAARLNGNDDLAAVLSQEKEVLKGKLRHHCLDCQTPIHRNAQRCQIHARAHRFKNNRKLAFAAIVLLCVFLLAGCSTHPKPIAIAPVKPIKTVSIPSSMMPLVIAQQCPSIIKSNGVTEFLTNCVVWRTVQQATNAAYGQCSFTAYWSTNNILKMQNGTGQPSDWIGPMFNNSHTWTMQYKFNLADNWQDGISDTNSQTYEQFSESDAIQPSAFFRVKYQ